MVNKEDFELDNNEHVIVQCSNCDKPLLDVWITRSQYPVKNEIRASCCFCDDDSFIINIDGAFHLGGCDGVGIANIDTTQKEDNLEYHYITTIRGKRHHGDS